jgi:trimeric autotransporter adhesin
MLPSLISRVALRAGIDVTAMSRRVSVESALRIAIMYLFIGCEGILLATNTLVAAHATVTTGMPRAEGMATSGESALAELRRVQVARGPGGLSVEFMLSGPVTPKLTSLHSPTRVVVDLPKTLARTQQRRTTVGGGGVKAVRVGMDGRLPPTTRVVVDLAQPMAYEIVPGSAHNLILRLHTLSARNVNSIESSNQRAEVVRRATKVPALAAPFAWPSDRQLAPKTPNSPLDTAGRGAGRPSALNAEDQIKTGAAKSESVSANRDPDTVDLAELRRLVLACGPGGLTVEFMLSGPVTPKLTALDSPTRVVVDLPKTVARTQQRRMTVGSNGVNALRVGMDGHVPPTTRVVVDLAQALDYEIVPGSHNRLILSLHSLVANNSGSIEAFNDNGAAPSAPKVPSSPSNPTAVLVAGGEIGGVVRSGSVLLPGATVFAIHSVTGQKFVTSTGVGGDYVLRVAPDGQYVVHAEMTAFAPATQQVLIDTSQRYTQVDLLLHLLSRARSAQSQTASPSLKESKTPEVTQNESTDAASGALEGPVALPEADTSPDSATESIVILGSPSAPAGGRPGKVDLNHQHGNVSYTLGDSALDATPYSLQGNKAGKPQYIQHRFSASLGGPLRIPGIYQGDEQTSFFLSFSGSRRENPFDAFSTVPTLLERNGNFSQTRLLSGLHAPSAVEIFNPQTKQQFVNNTLPPALINPAAARLLAFIPEPNTPGDVENFHFVTSRINNTNDINFRLVRTLAGLSAGQRHGKRNNVNLAFHYHTGHKVLTNPFPTVGGNTFTRSIDVNAGYGHSAGKLTNSLRFDFNRYGVATQNLYAFQSNIIAELGIKGVSQDPFDWGLPNLSFTNFSGLHDTNPISRHDQTFSISDSMIWKHGRHTMRWGGDFRRIQLNPRTDSNSRGSFTFTGSNTAQSVGGVPVSGTGFDFADFLLGLPQLTSVQFGASKRQFRGNSWDLFVQNDWRPRANLTLNVGLRYEYVSPFSEIDNRIVNLDVAPGFTAVASVLPGRSGPFTGTFPTSLINPDRNNFAPRLGIAWKPFSKTIARAGYAIHYNTGAYSNIVQQLAFQPPFSITQTNLESAALPLTLENGFSGASRSTITNNFGVSRDYRLGYVQVWNLDLQREMRSNVVMNLDYTGTKGTRLDILQAPNRGPDGVRIPGVQPFLWETSDGNSVAHSGTLRLRKRLQHGVSVGGSYIFSKSIDNASTIGGGDTVVAQDPFNLRAERGLSSFDQRQRFTADYLWELPFGLQRQWLAQPGIIETLFGEWQWSGDWTIASGHPFTAHVLGDFADVQRGTNGTLRADVTGQPVTLPNPTIADWFNTAAFAVPPLGQFGNAGRNTIPGPGKVVFNMTATKQIRLVGGNGRTLELRMQAFNLFNTPQLKVIDTVVNSPSYGRVTSVGSMRKLQTVVRLRF